MFGDAYSDEGDSPFEVGRGSDGRSFSQVGRLDVCAGSLPAYTFSYKTAAAWPRWYRLRMASEDGWAARSNTVMLSVEKTDVADVVVYPNPFGERLVVALTASTPGTATLRLRDAAGRICAAHELVLVKGRQQVFIGSVSALPAGVYWLEVRNADGELVYAQRIVRD